MTLAPDAVRSMFDRIAPVYDAMNRVMTAGLDLRWRRLAATAAVRPGDHVLDAACGTGDLALADRRAGAAAVTGLDFSARMLERARRKAPSLVGSRATCSRLPFEDGHVRRRHRRLRRPQRRRPRARPGGAPARAASGRPARDPRDHAAARGRCGRSSRSGSTGSCPLLGRLAAGRGRLPLPARLGRALPGRRGARRRCCEGAGFEARRVPAARRLDHRAPHRSGRVNALAVVDATPGLAALHGRARGAARPGRRPPRGLRLGASRPRRSRPAASGCGRCSASSPRPMPRASSCSRPASRPSSSTWRRSSTTISSTARACAAACPRPGRSSAPGAALAAGDYLFACAFAELAATEDSSAVAILADACLALARGEAMQRSQTRKSRRPRSTPTSSAAR